MHLAVCVVALAVVKAGWSIETAPLVEPGWEAVDAVPLDDAALGVLAVQQAPAADGGTTTTSAVFVTRPGQRPALLQRLDGRLDPVMGGGTGFTAERSTWDEGGSDSLAGRHELFRVRWSPPDTPTLVSLGEFRGDVGAVTCDDAVSVCVIIVERKALLWRGGTTSPLFQLPECEDCVGFNSWGAAMKPDGRFVALAAGGAAVVMSLATGAITVAQGRLTQRYPSLEKLAETLRRKPAFRVSWESAGELCATEPVRWTEGNIELRYVNAQGDIGAPDCNLTPTEFALDPSTGRRSRVPPYPWQVLDCPTGGWTSSVGTFVTKCLDDTQRSIRALRGDQDELPEAVALSERQVFVMAPPRPTEFRWYRGKPSGPGLAFRLEGPSVVTFQAKGVLVERIDWPFGKALFEHALADDWHVISHATTGARSSLDNQKTLVRVRAQP